MSSQLSAYFVLAFLLASSCNGTSLRSQRADGKTKIGKLVKPPLKLKQGEATIPAPGWTHCIRPITATNRWRFIHSDEFTVLQSTQFQCTWKIQSSQYQSNMVKQQKQIQVSVQTLAMGNRNDARCIRQFIEIIDSGKSQGRFCDSQKPGDYITIGGSVRIDIQGVDILASLIRLKKEAFVIGYRTVINVDPGFRSHATRVKSENNPEENENRYPKTPENNDDAEDDGRIGNLTLGGFVGVIVCCVLVSLLIMLIVIRKCCRKKEKNDKHRPDLKDDEEWNIYPPPYHKAVSLPLSPNPKTMEIFPPAPKIEIKKNVEVKKKNEKLMAPDSSLQSSSAGHQPKKESKADARKNEKKRKKYKKDWQQPAGKNNTNDKAKKARNPNSHGTKTDQQRPGKSKSDSKEKKMKRKLTADEKRRKKEKEELTIWQEDYPARRARRSKSQNRKKRKENLETEKSSGKRGKRKKRLELNGADKNGQKSKSNSSRSQTRKSMNTSQAKKENAKSQRKSNVRSKA